MININKISNILANIDIEGFIEIGAPEDEYISEATVIQKKIDQLTYNQLSYEIILNIVLGIWKDKFNLSASDMKIRQNFFESVAREIHKNIVKN